MPQGLLLLPLLGGFLFLHLSHVFRFNAQRYDGNRLILASAAAGAFLLLLGRAVVLLFGSIPLFGAWAGRVWYEIAPFPHSDSCAMACVLGPVLAVVIVNRMYDVEAAMNKQIEEKKHADAFTRLLHMAARDRRLVSVTLDSRKWYVGYIAEAPNLNPAEKYFRLLPIVSGFRDKDTLETFRTVFYEDVLETNHSSEFVITLPIADVKSAGFFDPNLYDVYFAEEDDDEEDKDDPAGGDEAPKRSPLPPFS